MPKKGSLESLLKRAENGEKKYEWLKAVKLYKQGLGTVGKDDFSKKGEIQEKIGRCFHRAAFQAEKQEEFQERMQRAIEAYEKAYRFYERLIDEQKPARMFRCEAITKYISYWLTSDPSEKRKHLDECLELEEKALVDFSKSGNMLEYGRTYNELPHVFFLRGYLEWDRQTFERILKRGQEWGERAVASLSELDNSYEIAKAYLALASCIIPFWYFFIAEPEEKDKKRQEVENSMSKTVQFSERVGDASLCGHAHWLWSMNTLDGPQAVRHLEKASEYGKIVGDRFLIAWGLDLLAYLTYWNAVGTEDPDKRRKLAEEAMQIYGKAQHFYSIISFKTPRFGVIGPPAGYAEHYHMLAEWETDPQKRLEFLEKSEKAGVDALRLAEDSDMPIVIGTVLHVVSKTLWSRAQMEPDPAERKRLLEKSLKYREKTIEIHEKIFTFDYWDVGVQWIYRAGIEAELASIEPEIDSKRRLLEEAVLSSERALKLCNKDMEHFELMGETRLFAALQGYQDLHAKLLVQLYTSTNKKEHLRRSIESQQKAIESANKLDFVSRIAESYWTIAKTQSILGEPLKAAGNFARSSESYAKAAEKIPQLKNFYQDHASYMEAWSEIEKAKHYHAEKQYGQAKEHYEKAADLHKATGRWEYLSSNYLALARFEEAENLSRREQAEEARDLFQRATKLFMEAKRSIGAKLQKIETEDEKEMAADLIIASDLRREYCLGRISLEEAKIFDRRGDHAASSRKYGSAAETFQKVADRIEYESDRQVLRSIVELSRAWQMMTRAEAEASPDLYLEASQLFDKSKEYSLDEKAKVLALGHSRFCKALEAGMRFEDNRDMTLYSTAKKHLEAAANYYLKAGFKTASEYARATNRLFDAYVYVHRAETETEPKKKAQYYQMAEKLLQTSAGSYTKAKHPEKSEEVLRLLESVKEEQQLVISLTEVLHVPTVTSTTTSFSTPTPSHEQAIGLERFEHADIQANLVFRVKEAKVGDYVEFRIEMVNAGKTPALLVKVDETVPEGFELKEVPEAYSVEDSFINMKGKRLNPLKTEDVKVVVKPQSKGTFVVKPRILYLDEAGKYKSHEPEPVTITVKELGISGWIKGEK